METGGTSFSHPAPFIALSAPSSSLRVTCIQKDAPCAPHGLTALLDDAVTRRPTDLYLLPELCTVPYLATAEERRARAETVNGPTASALCRWTASHDAAVLAGLVERGEHGLHNSVLEVDAGRVRGLYRKRHLTRYEKGLFLPGTENGLFQIRGHLVGIMVCFDLWFPKTGRNLLRRGALLFCAPATFGGPQTARLAALRALENLTPQALCNRADTEKAGDMEATFRGGSTLYAANGSILAQAPEHVRAVTAAEVILPEQRANAPCDDFLREMACHYPLQGPSCPALSLQHLPS